MRENFGNNQQWKLYYLYGLERVGRLTGQRFFGEHDWYREGAEELVDQQNKLSGSWTGALFENQQVIATSFALLFLAKGRAPVLINKLRHHPLNDWNLDPDDVRNLIHAVSRDWKRPLTWQVVDARMATVSDLRRAPILFVNGHKAPELSPHDKKTLRDYVEDGGFLFADACCGAREFDEGFRRVMQELFPEEGSRLQPLPKTHPVWRSRHELDPASAPLLGIQRNGRTVVIYSPNDLSCYWNQVERSPDNPAVLKAIKLGQNVIEFATRHEPPPDKLTVP